MRCPSVSRLLLVLAAPPSALWAQSLLALTTDVGGLARADDEDILETTANGLSLRYDLSTLGIDGARVDGRSFAFPPALLVDGFESGSAGAWTFRRP